MKFAITTGGLVVDPKTGLSTREAANACQDWLLDAFPKRRKPCTEGCRGLSVAEVVSAHDAQRDGCFEIERCDDCGGGFDGLGAAHERVRFDSDEAAIRAMLHRKAPQFDGADLGESLITAAAAHGEASDPEHQVGDLEEIVRAAWKVMSPEQRATVANTVGVSGFVEWLPTETTP